MTIRQSTMSLLFKSRLIGTLLFINLCVLVLGVSSYFFLGQVGTRLDGLTHGIFHRLELANDFRLAANSRAIAVRNAALLTDGPQKEAAFKEFALDQDKAKEALGALMDSAKRADLPSVVIQKIQRIGDVEAKYAPLADQIMADLRANKKEEAIRKIDTVCTPTLTELLSVIDDYMKVTDERTVAYIDETGSITRSQRITMLGTAIFSFVMSIFLGLMLLRNIRTTLGAEPESLGQSLGDLANGHLSAIRHTGTVAPNSILQAMLAMQNRIAEVVTQVRLASDSIATGSTEIASGNADLSKRTETQASSLQKTAAAMEQMSESVERNASAARSVSQVAQGVSHVASEGSEVMGRVTQTMDSIANSSKKIAEIIGVIDGIAFQTNILALNAAVEAARAGEQGRGFAVVAGEVRILAQKSAGAAREIKSLISESVERVQDGSTLVAEAGKSVSNIVNEVNKVTDLIQGIEQSAQEQSQGIQDVSSAITELDRSTQQNAALAEESAAAAESLRAQSRQLIEAVGYFKA
jgi:methyl-accepting chemotaxis protein